MEALIEFTELTIDIEAGCMAWMDRFKVVIDKGGKPADLGEDAADILEEVYMSVRYILSFTHPDYEAVTWDNL